MVETEDDMDPGGALEARNGPVGADDVHQQHVSDSTAGSHLRRYEGYVLLAFAALPLVVNPIAYDLFDLPKVVAFRGLLVVWAMLFAAAVYVHRRVATPMEGGRFALLYVAIAALATAFSVDINTSLYGSYRRYDGLLTVFCYVVLFYFAYQSARDSRTVERFPRALLLVALPVSIYGLAQFFGFDPIPWSYIGFESMRSASTFGNPNFLAGYLVLVLPLGIGAYVAAGGWRRLLYLVVLASIFATLVTSQTRGAWIAAAIAILVFALLAHGDLSKARRALAALIVALAGVGVTVFSIPDAGASIAQRAITVGQFTDGSAAQRIEIWKAAFDGVVTEPLIGWGPDTFKFVSERFETEAYATSTQGRRTADNPHNWLLQAATGSGVIALVALLAFFIWVFGRAIRVVRADPSDHRVSTAAAIAACIGYLAHSFFTVSVVGSAAIFWALLGLLAAGSSSERMTRASSDDGASVIPRGLSTAAGVLVLLSLVSAVLMSVGDYYMREASLAASGHRFDDAGSRYRQAVTWYPEAGKFHESMIPRDPAAMQSALEMYEGALAVEPNLAENHVNAGAVYGFAQQTVYDEWYAKAKHEFETALMLRPRSYQALLLLGGLHYANDDFAEAIPYLERVLAMNPDEKIAQELLASAQRKLGE